MDTGLLVAILLCVTFVKERPFFWSTLQTFSEQKKDVTTVVIGVGQAYKQTEKMKEIAGKKGKVLLYVDFDALDKDIEEVLEKACGKLTKFITIALWYH